MKYLYKLTDENGNSGLSACAVKTHWSEGITHEIDKNLQSPDAFLCSSSFIHCYEHPLIAVFMNSRHGNFKSPILWKCKGKIEKKDGQLKCGTFSLTTIKKLPLPVLSTTQRVKIAIYCSLTQKQSEKYKKWAMNWLNGKDRTYDAADATAAAAAYTATNAAAAHAAAAAAAADATYAAAANAVFAAYAAARAAAYDAAAADTSYAAIAAAAHAANNFDLLKIIHKVLRQKES